MENIRTSTRVIAHAFKHTVRPRSFIAQMRYYWWLSKSIITSGRGSASLSL